MKKIILLALIFSSQVFAADAPVDSNIDNVLLFPNRAIVTRKVKVKIAPPGQSVYFDKLPGELDRESLRAKVSDNKAANILGIRSRKYKIKKSEVENKEYRSWRKKKELYNKEMQVLREEAQKLIRENNMLKELLDHYQVSFPHNLHEGKWKSKDFKGFAGFALKRSKDMHGKWGKLFKEYMSLSQKSEFAQAKLYELDKHAPKGWNRVWIDLKVNKKRTVEVELEYLVQQASWKPSYGISLSKGKKKTVFSQQALVKQWTGEDWDNARIVLSNYQSQLKAKAPSNQSYRLRYKEVEKVKTTIKGTSKKNKELIVSSVSSNSGDQNLFKEFPIKGKVTLGSGLPELKIAIKDYSLDSEIFYEVIPSRMKLVYQRATLDNNLDFSLASGPVDVYVDGLYQQQFQLPFTAKGKPILVNIGYNYDIQVHRTQRNIRGKKGLLGGKKEYQKIINNNVHNWSQDRVRLRVYEQFPKSETEEIEVTTESRPATMKEDKQFETWKYWEFDVGPEKGANLELTLKVITPEDYSFNW